MEVALTFGSLGDIIAVCQIAIQLGKALGVGYAGVSGSAKEYQDLRKNLDTFVQVLMHREFSPTLDSLAHATKSVVEECGALIKEALDRFVPRYNDSLQPGGSRTSHETIVKEQTQQLAGINQRLDTQEESRGMLLDIVGKTSNAIIQVKEMLVDVAEKVAYLHIMVSNAIYIRGLDPTKDLPIILEDALGISLPLPENWLEDWEDLIMLLQIRFKKRKGYDMVLKRQFALEENWSGRDLDQTLPLIACLRPGMKINMSMVFVNPKLIQGSCPRCKTAIDAPEDITIQCQNEHCGMWFRLLKLIFEEHEDNFDQDGMDLDQAASSFEPPNRAEMGNRKDSTKVFSIPAEPSDFQRVRLLSITSPPRLDGAPFSPQQAGVMPNGQRPQQGIPGQQSPVTLIDLNQTSGSDHKSGTLLSSYWSVSEATEFPLLLRSFGSDWAAIASHMRTKTAVMVKNYYARRKDAGTGWEAIVNEADAKKALGEKRPAPPAPSISGVKKRYETSGNRLVTAVDDIMEGVPLFKEEHPATPQSITGRFNVPIAASPIFNGFKPETTNGTSNTLQSASSSFGTTPAKPSSDSDISKPAPAAPIFSFGNTSASFGKRLTETDKSDPPLTLHPPNAPPHNRVAR
ncbi:hypothetical protein DL771_006148 [Monosporascus sp. 5C6A]|nr:hypothetical protein DL771_006148 [Monosporascus sp. 5C6A]